MRREIWQMDCRNTEGSFVELLAETARSNESIDMFGCSLQQTGVPPPLWRTLVCERADEALPSGARLPVELEQHMSGADQPILVHRVEFYRLAVVQQFWTADERQIVVVNDIKTLVEDLPNPPRLKEGHAGLLRGERRQKTEWTAESVYPDARVLLGQGLRLLIR